RADRRPGPRPRDRPQLRRLRPGPHRALHGAVRREQLRMVWPGWALDPGTNRLEPLERLLERPAPVGTRRLDPKLLDSQADHILQGHALRRQVEMMELLAQGVVLTRALRRVQQRDVDGAVADVQVRVGHLVLADEAGVPVVGEYLAAMLVVQGV